MGTEKPDLTPSAGVARVRKPTFATVWRGYDPNQVLEYLSRVADHVQDLESQVRKLESEVREARRQGAPRDHGSPGQDPYEAVSARVADVVRTFDHEVERLREEAEVDADRILAEARADAERLRIDAQSKADEVRAIAERTLRDARREAEQVVSDLTARREALLAQLRGIRDRMLDNVGHLEETIEGEPAGNEVVIVENAHAGGSADPASSGQKGAQPKPGS